MSVTPTAGIAAAWSAAKPNPSAQAVQPADSKRPDKTGRAADKPGPEPAKGPPAPEGQGTRVDVRV